MNKVTLSGNIVEEVKFEQRNGNYYMRNKIAVNDNYGTDFEDTYFMPIRVFKDELLAKFEEWGKGKLISVEGKVVYKTYKNDNGEWKNFFEIVVFDADEIVFNKKEDNKKSGFKPRKK